MPPATGIWCATTCRCSRPRRATSWMSRLRWRRLRNPGAAVLQSAEPDGQGVHGRRTRPDRGLCRENDTLIISDEIHCDLLFDGRRHIPIATLSDDAARPHDHADGRQQDLQYRRPEDRLRDHSEQGDPRDASPSRGSAWSTASISSALRRRLLPILAWREWKSDMLAISKPTATFSRNRSQRASPISVWSRRKALSSLGWIARDGLTPDPQAFFLEHGKRSASAPAAEFGAAYAELHPRQLRLPAVRS
jgi:cystathionine beta-lyase